jgi:hypothetical protein
MTRHIAIKKHPLYHTWDGMKARCQRANHHQYKNYGGKGISICERWLKPNGDGFWNFVEDMGKKEDNTTLDRIDNNLGYCKGNCKWSNIHQQNSNKSNSAKVVGVNYRSHCNMYRSKITINHITYQKYFMLESDAIAYRKELEDKYIHK